MGALLHGVLLVSTILGDPDTKALWVEELRAMVNRICKMREALQEKPREIGISSQLGTYNKPGWHVLLFWLNSSTDRAATEGVPHIHDC